MTMRVTIITTLMGESGSLLTAGSTYTVSKTFGAAIVGDKRATDIDNVLREGAVVSISTDTLITAADDGRQLNCTTALILTVPDGLSPKPSIIAVPPASGNLTVTPTGGATINGSASAATRNFSSNRNGVVLTPNPHDVHDYSLSGS